MMSRINQKFCSLFWGVALALAALVWTPSGFAETKDNEKENDRIQNAGTVLKEVLDVPEDIPKDLLNKARCVIVLPSVLKAAFVVGGDYGRGVMTCRTGRDRRGTWGAPLMMALEGGSVGFQIGGEATDFVILVMNSRGADSLLHSKVKLGADASVAGVSLEGSTLRPDGEANERLYGKDVSATDIVAESKAAAPKSAHKLLSVLQQASPHLKA